MDIHIRRLSKAHDGLRIVQLTDIHHSLYTPLEDVERAVRMANHLQPDLIALTGDYVTFSPTYIWPVAQVLGQLRARLGVGEAGKPKLKAQRSGFRTGRSKVVIWLWQSKLLG